MSENPFKKSTSEKAILKNIKKQYNINQKKLNSKYVKSKACLGLKTNSSISHNPFKEIPALLEMAKVILTTEA